LEFSAREIRARFGFLDVPSSLAEGRAKTRTPARTSETHAEGVNGTRYGVLGVGGWFSSKNLSWIVGRRRVDGVGAFLFGGGFGI
jgi:hypothetical protein